MLQHSRSLVNELIKLPGKKCLGTTDIWKDNLGSHEVSVYQGVLNNELDDVCLAFGTVQHKALDYQ